MPQRKRKINVIDYTLYCTHMSPENTHKLMGILYVEVIMLGIILQYNVLKYNGFCFLLFLIRVHGFKKRAHLKLNVDVSYRILPSKRPPRFLMILWSVCLCVIRTNGFSV